MQGCDQLQVIVIKKSYTSYLVVTNERNRNAKVLFLFVTCMTYSREEVQIINYRLTYPIIDCGDTAKEQKNGKNSCKGLNS